MADVIYSGGATDTQVVVDKDGTAERGLKVMAVSGDLLYDGGATDTQVVVQTDDGPERAEKVYNLNGGGGGGGTVDQTYDATSTNAQSGTAVAEAVAPALKNTATGTNALTILGTPTSYTSTINIGASNNTSWSQNTVSIGVSNTVSGHGTVAVGNSINASGACVSIGDNADTQTTYCVAIGSNATCGGSSSNKIAIGNYAYANQSNSIAIGTGTSQATSAQANADNAIQIGTGSNTTASTFQVYTYPMLDGTTGKIPAERLGTGFDATKTQVLKNVQGVLTWVDE